MSLEETQNEIRARVTDPDQYDSFARKVIDEAQGISAVLGIKGGKSEIQSYRFDKKKDWTIAKAKAWLAEHNITVLSLSDNGQISVKKLREVKSEESVRFYYDLGAIELADDLSKWIPLMKETHGHQHAAQGTITITKDELIKYKSNFEQGMNGYELALAELPIDLQHDPISDAMGWIKELRLIDNGTVLEGRVGFTPQGAKKLKDKEVKFFSPTYVREFLTKTGEVIKNVLLGGSLVNRPFLDMPPITLSENFSCQFLENPKKKGESQMDNQIKLGDKIVTAQDVINLNDQVETLSEEKKETDKKNETLENENKELKKEKEELEEGKKKAEEEKETQLFDTAFSKILEDGKVVPASKDKLKEKFTAIELSEFYDKMPQILKLGDKTGVSGADSKEIKLGDAERKNLKENGGDYTLEEILESRNRNQRREA